MKFEWDAVNLKHAQEHGVPRWEIEAVLSGRCFRFFAATVYYGSLRQPERRYIALGRSSSSQVVTIVYAPRKRLVRPITAFPTKRLEQLWRFTAWEQAEAQRTRGRRVKRTPKPRPVIIPSATPPMSPTSPTRPKKQRTGRRRT